MMRHLTKLAALLLITRALFAADPIEVTATGTWNSGTYLYDGSGNVKAIGTNVYRYDTAGRLVSANANGTGYLQTYGYDAFGNRILSTTTPAHPCIGGIDCEENVTINPATNHINSAANLPSYDDAGNLTALDGTNYVYDSQSMLRSQSNSGAQFIYTADDQRLATISSGGSWNWTVRDLDGKVLSDFTSENSPTAIGTTNFQWKKDYIYRDGLLLAASGSSGTEHFHLDHLGTPRLVTDANGAEIGAHTYFPFGAELALTPTESPVEPMKFTGHERDYTAGVQDLDYMHARYYGGAVGRFASVDRELDTQKIIHEPQLWNRYAYVSNNPVQYIDSNGRERELPYCVRHRCTAAELQERSKSGNEVWYTGAIVGSVLVGPELAVATFTACLGNLAACTTLAGEVLQPPGPSQLPTIPTLKIGDAREMAQEAVGITASLKGSAAQKVETFEALAAQIETATRGAWGATKMAAGNGITVFFGRAGEALVITAEGQVFRGKLNQGIQVTKEGLEFNWALLREVKPAP